MTLLSTTWRTGQTCGIFQVRSNSKFAAWVVCLGLIIVDVYTRWAGPCDVMKPIINKVKTSVTASLSCLLLTCPVSSCPPAETSWCTPQPAPTPSRSWRSSSQTACQYFSSWRRETWWLLCTGRMGGGWEKSSTRRLERRWVSRRRGELLGMSSAMKKRFRSQCMKMKMKIEWNINRN